MPLLCFNWGLAGRCAHKTPAIGGRFPHLRPEKCKLSHTGKSAKRRRWWMKRAGFEEVARLARPKGRGNRNATTVTSEKTIQIYFASADAKVCDAFCRLRAAGVEFWGRECESVPCHFVFAENFGRWQGGHSVFSVDGIRMI